jgi:uncharacterized protein
MLRFILFLVLFIILFYVLRFLIKDMVSARKKVNHWPESEELVQDPYCQTYIPKRSALKKKIAGRLHYFCSHECLKNYVKKLKNKKVDKSKLVCYVSKKRGKVERG